MTPERLQQVRELFAAALEREPGARRAYLQQACQRDPDLLGEVEKLLRSHEQAGGFLAAWTSTPGGNAASASGAPAVATLKRDWEFARAWSFDQLCSHP